jgi:sterol desaturase/sphingolipid hydroxylase (fatty acid hydroxylase superfamily)
VKLVTAVLRYASYPVLMIGALGILHEALRLGAPLTWAPYLAVAIAGPLVLVTERVIPHRASWLPTGADFILDAKFMAVVQVGVPLALAWLAALALRSGLAQAGLMLDVWPHSWPELAQLALKVVSGDFLRYWLHRAAHTWTPLWRLHQVHHHPDKLYTTNVFRFHPVEKGLQFFCDTLPFLFLGVGAPVLAYYFVFYAISGLFQHSNCDLRLGWFNFLVSGPEVHRWHHSLEVSESNNNYAHSFVVWDLLFGTYYRPRHRLVARLGLVDEDYPTDFIHQLGAPFRLPPRRRGAAA